MKSKDLQNIVLSKCQQDDIPTEIHDGGISLATIKNWCQIIRQSATRYMSFSTDSQGTKES